MGLIERLEAIDDLRFPRVPPSWAAGGDGVSPRTYIQRLVHWRAWPLILMIGLVGNTWSFVENLDHDNASQAAWSGVSVVTVVVIGIMSVRQIRRDRQPVPAGELPPD